MVKSEIRPGSKAGDQYASLMFKIVVSYETRGRSVVDRRFVLKTMPEVDGQKKELLGQTPMFDNEIRMYGETLPAMEKLLLEHGEKPWWPK